MGLRQVGSCTSLSHFKDRASAPRLGRGWGVGGVSWTLYNLSKCLGLTLAGTEGCSKEILTPTSKSGWPCWREDTELIITETIKRGMERPPWLTALVALPEDPSSVLSTQDSPQPLVTPVSRLPLPLLTSVDTPTQRDIHIHKLKSKSLKQR